MNIRKTILLSAVAVAFAAPGLSSATSLWHQSNLERGDTFYPDHLKSSKTRAEVVQELEVARQDGTFSTSLAINRNYSIFKKTPGSGKTRAEVLNELLTMSAEEKNRMEELYSGGSGR